MSLDDIWVEPIASPPKPAPADSPQKRPRQSLFLSDSDSDYERPPKRATPAPPPARPDVDALFEDLDKDEEDDGLRYKPLAPALDLENLAKEAEARHARARQTAPSQTLANGSKTGTTGSTGWDSFAKDEGKGNPGDGEKKGRKVLPKSDEERLVGPEGFPLLIKEIKGFEPKGKGNEHVDLNRLLQVYQFWTHKMYPKTSFKDTVNRVEKLCHSKRMQVKTPAYLAGLSSLTYIHHKVRLSVWRDEFKGVTNGKKLDDDPDVIDLAEPTLVGTEDDGDDKESEDPQLKSVRASERTPSLPPASSEADDDDFDIDAVIRAEEDRLATLRAATTDSESLHTSRPPTLPEKVPTSNSNPEAMDVDEASLWESFDDPPAMLDPPQSGPPPSAPVDDDEGMWNIVDEMEQEQQRKPISPRIPVSGVNLIPSLDSTDSGNASRATNDDDWDEMYS
ncbi:replication fork protection component Swi3-domain-containing protein [Boletus reticuloceps]|uniref:Chromosome segregation in meiosis protein n=1 Tax=Boletus reticuloceps TaxID=495285 RepID=A0A8I2YDD9_9AGAM|nr:replication fork protection component Swi3-domain-containing protein [Boletus reticuloceps]